MKFLVKNILLFQVIVIILAGCKKYPENRVWFTTKKNLEKRLILNGYIKSYKVNGIDSLDLLNSYFTMNTNAHLYGNIRMCRLSEFEDGIGDWKLGDDCTVDLHHRLIDNDTKMNIFLGRDTRCFNKNIFIDVNVKWTILNFPTKRKPGLKLKSIVNGNTYEIQISN
jgi:hypothetical protein